MDVPVAWAEELLTLYRQRYDRMVRLAYLVCGDRAAAEEIVQDAFVATHGAWSRVREPAAYLRTAVVNGCRSWGRHRALELARRPPPPEPAVLGARELWDALDVLTPRQRAAIVLRFYEDLPDADIAELLGCRQATVRTSIHRALRALRQEIDR